MLIGLGKGPRPERPSGVVESLLDCHDRIRRFTKMGTALAEGTLPVEEARDVARAVARYFEESLPLHSADEDQSVAPRLLAKKLSDTERAAVERMTGQHETIEATLRALLPMWRAEEADPTAPGARGGVLETTTLRLVALWGEHLTLEETIVFPLVRQHLSAEEQTLIHEEMRARRTGARAG